MTDVYQEQVKCPKCGGTVVLPTDKPTDDTPVKCADCNQSLGTFGEFISNMKKRIAEEIGNAIKGCENMSLKN
ncbi:ECs_2282 family putative zinc-binding protein [Rhodoblastus acidophilus]|uniref:ECs_2282 family putative zinc-binding protein n=1 Tax=Rhodoblastus acidophilus TaxID=1074 RepID=UPI0011308509|nr:hypothetical protein [Rhodoblastus acidophilus]